MRKGDDRGCMGFAACCKGEITKSLVEKKLIKVYFVVVPLFRGLFSLLLSFVSLGDGGSMYFFVNDIYKHIIKRHVGQPRYLFCIGKQII